MENKRLIRSWDNHANTLLIFSFRWWSVYPFGVHDWINCYLTVGPSYITDWKKMFCDIQKLFLIPFGFEHFFLLIVYNSSGQPRRDLQTKFSIAQILCFYVKFGICCPFGWCSLFSPSYFHYLHWSQSFFGCTSDEKLW